MAENGFGNGWGGGGSQYNQYYLNLGWTPIYGEGGAIYGWQPPVDPENGLPDYLKIGQVGATVEQERARKKSQFLAETVNPAVAELQTKSGALGETGTFGAARVADLAASGAREAENAGTDAANAATDRMLALRSSYMGSINQQQQLQQQKSSSMQQWLEQEQQRRMTAQQASANKLQGAWNVGSGLLRAGASNQDIRQGYNNGGLIGAARAIPRAVGNIFAGQ
jgi:hypothetical protein